MILNQNILEGPMIWARFFAVDNHIPKAGRHIEIICDYNTNF